MKFRLILLFVFVTVFCGYAQNPDFNDTQIVNGFDKKISGDDFSYHSSIPPVKESLLIRATDGNSVMEWETGKVPEKLEKKYVTFVWLAGLGSSPGRASFDLQVNGKALHAFWVEGQNSFSQTAADGSTLSFKSDMTDQHGDKFGFMYLKMHAANLEKGKPVRIKVTGGDFEKTSWYMTFKFQLNNKLNLKTLPALATQNGAQQQLGVFEILHFGEPEKARIFVDNKLVSEPQLNFGYNYVRVFLPEVSKPQKAKYRLETGTMTEKGELTLNPVRKWRVNFVQHSHTDIGYTRPQTEILAEHLRYIDYALDYCDMTDSYPDAAKFRWVCEASWAVDEYLKSRPAAQIERFKKRVKEGRIELTGMYFNFDELPDEQILAASLQPIKRFKTNGLDVKVAMQNDVNGIGWCLNDYYKPLGVKYLNMGTHGHRALIAFDKPTLFWWESPSGNRMLAYRSEHYMIGNTEFGIHASDFNRFEDELLSYLIRLEEKGYQYDLISLQHSGYLTDNAPPSTLASDMIKKWNEKYNWPKLQTATATSFFEEMEAKHEAEFQVIRGAWPDWWTDGFGASAREVSAVRTAQTDLVANAAALSMAALQGAKMPEKISDRIEVANSALLFYTEHTVGYHGSVREPFHKNTMEQRALKESYAWEAGRRTKMLGEEAMGLLQGFIQKDKYPSLVVYNTLNWNRSGLFRVYIDHQIIPRDRRFRIVSENGDPATAQVMERFSDGAYWAIWVNDVPAFGFKKYRIVPEDDVLVMTELPSGEPKIVENQWYRLDVDKTKGVINGIFDKELNKELVDPNAEWKMGQFIYETLGNRSQMESKKLDNYKRETLTEVSFEGYTAGPVWNTLRFKGKTPAALEDGYLTFEIRLFNTTKRIELAYHIDKKMVIDPEGIYIALPFALENGQHAFDVQGGEIRAGIDQIPGSSNDWNTVQNYARLSDDSVQILLASKETPLMQFGGINTGRYKAGAVPATMHIYGWPMNNYWVTNFNAEIHGGFEWSYVIGSQPVNSQQAADRFGREINVPMLSRVIPGGGSGGGETEKSIITGWPGNIVLVSAMPSENGSFILLHVRETAGQPATVDLQNGLTGNALKITETDVLGNEINDGSTQLKPLESKFLKVELR